MSLLNVENLTHGFEDKILFKNVSFRLLKGERAGLVGANGAGKTTLFNLLNGKLIPDSGTIKWSNSIKLGYLDQHSDLEPGLSIRDTLRNAFKELYDIEKEINILSEKLTNGIEIDLEKLLKRLGNLQDTLYLSNFYSIDSIIDNVASGLGLNVLGLSTSVDKLSGGQRTRVLLAKLLLQNPDLLLLDEPTNYLDKEHVDWLSEYLKSYPNSFIVISHDTKFLSSIVNVIFHMEFGTLKRYPGNYDTFLKMHENDRQRYIDLYYSQKAEIERMENFVKSNIVRASTTKRAQSRQKQLDKIERLEKPKNMLKPSFSFPYIRESGRLIFESSQLDIGYSYPLLKGLTLKLEKGQKVAVTGCNGIGKTTLLKTLMGIIPELGGTIDFGDYLYPAYYEQETYNKSELTPLEEIWSDFPRLTQKEVRSALARCGLKEEHVMQSLKHLSGGEQSKVRLCKLTLIPSNWLLLDEPTNHLDLAAKEALKESLFNFKGSILLVSHEKEFYEDWITDVWDMEEMMIKN